MRQYYVYILASQRNRTLYIGVTNDLIKRVWQHKNKVADGFTKKYAVDKLVYYETTENIESAILREKQLKNWHRQWKINLIQSKNPEWRDLYQQIIEWYVMLNLFQHPKNGSRNKFGMTQPVPRFQGSENSL